MRPNELTKTPEARAAFVLAVTEATLKKGDILNAYALLPESNRVPEELYDLGFAWNNTITHREGFADALQPLREHLKNNWGAEDVDAFLEGIQAALLVRLGARAQSHLNGSEKAMIQRLLKDEVARLANLNAAPNIRTINNARSRAGECSVENELLQALNAQELFTHENP